MAHLPRTTARLFRLTVGVVAAIGALAVLAPVVLVVQLAAQEKPQTPKQPVAPLRLVPEDATAFIQIRVADIQKSKAFQLVPPAERASFLREICMGIPVEQVEMVTIASVMPDGMLPYEILPSRPAMYRSEPRWEKDVPFDKDVMRKDFMPKKDGFKNEFDIKDKLPVRDKVKLSLREKLALGRNAQIDKDVSYGKKDGRPFGPGFEDTFERNRPPVYLTVCMRGDLDVEDLILLRPEKAFKSKGKTILQIQRGYFHPLDKRTLVGAQRQADLERLLERKVPATFQGPLAPALEFASADRATISAGWHVPAKELAIRERAFNEGRWGGPERGLYRALVPLWQARPAALALDLDTGRAQAEFHYADADAAKPAAIAAQDALVLLRVFALSDMERAFLDRHELTEPDELQKMNLGKLLVAELGEALRSARVEIRGNTVKVAAKLPSDLGTLEQRAKAAVTELVKDESFLSARRGKVSANNLKQIVLAMHGFHDENKMLPPPAICDPNGKPLLSWRVVVLPYIDENALYQQFKLDEAWDSPHNIKLLEKMPKVYAVPGAKTREPHTTYYQAFVGPGAGFELQPAAVIPFRARGLRFPAGFPDGISNTFLVAEAQEAVPWTKPADLKFEPDGPLPKLGGPFAPGFHVAFADGVVRYVPRLPEDDVLRAYITRSFGDVPGPLPK